MLSAPIRVPVAEPTVATAAGLGNSATTVHMGIGLRRRFRLLNRGDLVSLVDRRPGKIRVQRSGRNSW